ncbi:hypothetical protein CONPUDRAFT_83309 [Coniophora puteana RWD-64-598 SS2]|uniref:Uncharacterized protein n=1 Tax=Coniophora puteana (strain RWD-64-598) TaxID=741705 RepID=A0A5M3MI40_CONPW|nr:uncharacterized protein CONPUDRAFT_83309 [Coniophora puteana RWD-64-598 SS2]EIW78909.1 hypothetical protein CONPUDRAFT_83309 [Coniophora puteana RWD-64-598 SS2]
MDTSRSSSASLAPTACGSQEGLRLRRSHQGLGGVSKSMSYTVAVRLMRVVKHTACARVAVRHIGYTTSIVSLQLQYSHGSSRRRRRERAEHAPEEDDRATTSPRSIS